MTTLDFPAIRKPNRLTWRLIGNTQKTESPLSRSVKTAELPSPRWGATLEYHGLEVADAVQMQAFLAQLRGQAGRFNLPYFERTSPRGTANKVRYADLPGVDGNYLSTPDAAANSITGEIDLRASAYFPGLQAPDFFLDFVGDPDGSIAKITGVSPAIGTISGGANGTRINSSGLIESASAPRIDYDPVTREARGLLIEEARTNVVLYNRDLTNAAWTKTNVTAAKDQTGLDGSANSASKITASAGNGTCLQSITLASSARFQTAYVKRITGTGAVEMTMDNGATWTAVTVTGDWTRVSIPTQTLANPTVGFRIVTSGDAIAVDFVQNENGTSATSPIPTTTAAVTRSADSAIITDISGFFNATEGTIQVEADLQAAAGNEYLLQVDDGTNNERFALIMSAADIARFFVADGGVTQVDITNSTAWAKNTAYRAVAVYKANDFGLSSKGASTTTDVAGTLPTVTTMRIGQLLGGTNYPNGHIRRLAYWATRQPNGWLQANSRRIVNPVIAKWVESGNQRSYALVLNPGNTLSLFVSTDGSDAREFSSVPMTNDPATEPVHLRVHLAPASGSPTEAVCTFYESLDGQAWTQIGSSVTQTTLSIFDGTAAVEIGSANAGQATAAMRVYGAEIRDASTVQVRMNPGEWSSGSTWVSGTGETWTVNASGSPDTEIQTSADAPAVAGASQTGNALITRGWQQSGTGLLLQGDCFSVNGEFKMVTGDVSADQFGVATVNFEPPLRSSPADAAALTLTSPTVQVMLTGDEQQWDVTPGKFWDFTLDCVEMWA